MKWWLGLLLGMGAGLIALMVIIPIVSKVKSTKERMMVKKLIKEGKYLQPIDPKDYDSTNWEGIDKEKNAEILSNFDERIFKRNEKYPIEFLNQVKEYLVLAESKGISRDKVVEEFKSKNYPQNLIDELLGKKEEKNLPEYE